MTDRTPTQSKWTSRKFLLSVSAQLTALIVLFWPEHEQAIVEAATSITSLVVILATSLGYIVSEAAVDARNVSADMNAGDA